jgi:hypothetical protein
METSRSPRNQEETQLSLVRAVFLIQLKEVEAELRSARKYLGKHYFIFLRCYPSIPPQTVELLLLLTIIILSPLGATLGSALVL